MLMGNLTNIPAEEITVGDRIFGLWEVVAIQKADNFGKAALQFTFPDRKARLVVNIGVEVPVNE
jgi:hypothetical protein